MPIISISGSQGSGKAQPLYSKILTPTGWKNFGDLQLGDEVITPSGELSKISHIFPKGIKSVYTIYTHDGASTQACEDHLWKCSFARYTKLKGKLVYLKCNEVVDTKFIKQYLHKNNQRKLKNWGCGISLPVISDTVEPNFTILSDNIPPYLLGCLLGDGGFTCGSISYTTTDSFLIEKCTSLLKEGYSFVSYSLDNINFTIKGTEIGKKHWYIEQLKKLGLYNKLSDEKFIPEAYKSLPNSDKWELLRGLMDTDGTASKTGSTISFTSTSLLLAQDVQRLVWSLGGTASLNVRHPHYKNNVGELIAGKTAYEVIVKHTNSSQFFHLPRKKERCLTAHYEGHKNGPISLKRRIVDIEYKGEEEVMCIMIDHPDHLYITDDYIVTHNTTLLKHLKDLGHNVIGRKTSRSILSDWNVSLEQVNNDPDLTLKFQQEILSRKYSDECLYVPSKDIWFTERTYADLMAYFLIALGKTNRFSNNINEYYRECITLQQQFHKVFYLKAGHFVPDNDDVRGANVHYSRMVDLTMLDLTQQMTPVDRLNVIQTPCLEQRLQIILAHSNLL